MTETYDDRYNTSESATRYVKRRVSEVAPILDNDNDPSERRRNVGVKPTFWTSVVAGGVAGIVVDFSLYPLDTIKTRMQSKGGLKISGGFKQVYKGITPVLLCSAPISALFFCVYNSVINSLRTDNPSLHPVVYIIAASAAELLCSCVRVPLDIVKQRKQTTASKTTHIIQATLKGEGVLGFYRGFASTVAREVPFACIQYPLWEYMINQLIIYQNGKELTALQTAYCGAAAGATAAALTTPVDVIRTRIMLAEKEKMECYKPHLLLNFAMEVLRDRGLTGFFAGVLPRTLWIMLGGFIYFGAYEKAKLICEEKWCYFRGGVDRVRDLAPSYLEETIDSVWTARFCHDAKKMDNKEGNKDHQQKIVDATLLHPSASPEGDK